MATAMNGLELTYQFLATTPNRAAVQLLVPAMQCQQPDVRRRALAALLRREPLEGGRAILCYWPHLEEDERVLLMDRGAWFREAVEESLGYGGQRTLTAIDVARSLSLYALAPLLIEKVESDASYAVRREALSAVLQMSALLGQAARQDRDRPSVRGPVLERLFESLLRHPIHRCDTLIDAYLACSSWSDSRLQATLAEAGPSADLLMRRLRDSQVAAVVALLAGYLRRRQIPAGIDALLRSRADAALRDALLEVVGQDLTTTLRRNLASLKLPACCRAPVAPLGSLAPAARVSLALVHAASDSDPVRVMSQIVTVLEQVPGETCPGLMQTLARLRFPDTDGLLRAAVLLSEDDPSSWAQDRQAVLLNQMLRLIDSPDAWVVRAVRAVLQPLHADAILGRLESLRPRTRQRLAAIVKRIDPQAAQRVHDQLRHPVMARRLEAIAATAAFDFADLLRQPLIDVAMNDHQQARLEAAAALGTGTGTETLEALQRLAGDVNGPVRDAAREALRTRGELSPSRLREGRAVRPGEAPIDGRPSDSTPSPR